MTIGKFDTNSGPLYQSKNIAGIAGLTHGFGVKGVEVAAYLDAFGIKDRFIFETDQMHANTVHCLMRPRKGGVLEGDAFVTDRAGLVCFVRTADCVPILIADKNGRAVAAIHAGWRGTVLDVAGETIRTMKNVYGVEPENCVAAIGPRICGECYEVGHEVIEAIEKVCRPQKACHPCAPLAGTSEHSVIPARLWQGPREDRVDLGAVNRLLLERAGLLPESISIMNTCTRCNTEFASYRRDKDDVSRQFNFIMISC